MVALEHWTLDAGTPPKETPMVVPRAVGNGPPWMVTAVPPCIGPSPGESVFAVDERYVNGVEVMSPPWLKRYSFARPTSPMGDGGTDTRSWLNVEPGKTDTGLRSRSFR